MRIKAKFEKVSFEQYAKDFEYDLDVKKVYDAILLPKRATRGSAGYDFYSPIDFTLAPGQTIKIPTGIRVSMEEDYVLILCPRSGLGFKYRLQLNNTIGIIDADYYSSSNEGHIFAKITNDSNENKTLSIQSSEAFMQGIFLEYAICEDDNVISIRDGGFGSTSNKIKTVK